MLIFRRITYVSYIRAIIVSFFCLSFTNRALCEDSLRPNLGQNLTYKRTRSIIDTQEDETTPTKTLSFNEKVGAVLYKGPKNMVLILGISGLADRPFRMKAYEALLREMLGRGYRQQYIYDDLRAAQKQGFVRKVSLKPYYELTPKAEKLVQEALEDPDNGLAKKIKTILLKRHIDIKGIREAAENIKRQGPKSRGLLEDVFTHIFNSKEPLTKEQISSELDISEETAASILCRLVDKLQIVCEKKKQVAGEEGHITIYFLSESVRERYKDVRGAIKGLPFSRDDYRLMEAYIKIHSMLGIERVDRMPERIKKAYTELYLMCRYIFDNNVEEGAIERKRFKERLASTPQGLLIDIIEYFSESERKDDNYVYRYRLFENIEDMLDEDTLRDINGESGPAPSVIPIEVVKHSLPQDKGLIRAKEEIKEEIRVEVSKTLRRLLDDKDTKDWGWIIFCVYILEAIDPGHELLKETKQVLMDEPDSHIEDRSIFHLRELVRNVGKKEAKRLIRLLDPLATAPRKVNANIEALRLLFLYSSLDYMKEPVYLKNIKLLLGHSDPRLRWHAKLLRMAIDAEVSINWLDTKDGISSYIEAIQKTHSQL